MTDAHEFDFAKLAEPVARELFKEPNKNLSKGNELRFGTNGSLKVTIRGEAAGTFSDFESENSGGLLDLINLAIGGDHKQAREWLIERFGHSPPQKPDHDPIISAYVYQNEAGQKLFEVLRTKTKRFWQRQSETVNSVKGLRIVPYRLPEIIEAIATEKIVFIVEGEKDADRLANLGAEATCNAGGAGKWKAEHSACLRDANVVIIPDNDKAGEDHADKVAKSLKNIASRIRVLRLIGVKRKGDVSDWLDDGGSIEELYDRAEKASDWEPASHLPLTWLGEEDRVPPRSWLVKGLLGKNELSIVHAPSGGGKSFFALDLAARIAAGMEWNNHTVNQCPVLYVAAEGASGFRQRMKAWRQKHEQAAYAPFVMLPCSLDLLDPKSNAPEILQEALAEIKRAKGKSVGMIVIDTLSRTMPGGVDTEPRDVKMFLENTDQVRRETGAHIMIIHHSGKDIERGMRGSSMLRDYSDTVIEIKGRNAGSPMKAVIQKQKDGEDGQAYCFTLLQSVVGIDEDGDDIISCVVNPIGASEGNEPGNKPYLTKQELRGLQCLVDLIRREGVTSVTNPETENVTENVTLDQWKTALKNEFPEQSAETLRQTYSRLKKKLLAENYIGHNEVKVWLA